MTFRNVISVAQQTQQSLIMEKGFWKTVLRECSNAECSPDY